VHEEWTDAEIRGFRERITMERRRAERQARTKRKEPRPLVSKRRRSSPKGLPAPAAVAVKKRRLAG
jgi:hypothetical protein